MAGRKSSIVFIYLFIGALVGLMFAPEINSMSDDAATNATAEGYTMAATIYGYLPTFYALCLVGLMVGSLYKFFTG